MPAADMLQDTLARFIAQERLPEAFLTEVVPTFQVLARHIAQQAAGSATPFIVGLCGPQGSGKSTLTSLLRRLLEADGRQIATLSLDDVYLPRAGRAALAASVHPLLATRGVPGTHDVELALMTLDALREPGELALPSFDKATDDRQPPERWSRIATPVDIVIFEGWCMGAQPQPDAALVQPVNALERTEDADGRWRKYVNDQLKGTYQTLFGRLDLLVLLEAEGFETVFEWRAEQERKLRERIAQTGGDGSRLMDDAGLRRFIAHYERLTRHILAEMPGRADVVIALDRGRHIRQVHGLGDAATAIPARGL